MILQQYRVRLQASHGLRGQDGFIMMEMVIAFAILALGMGAILAGVATAVRSDSRVRDSRIMMRIVQSRLESAGITGKLVVGRHEGRIGPFTWQERVKSAGLFADRKNGKPASESGGGVVPVWVEVVVSGPGGQQERLSALKFAPRVAQ